MVVAAFLALSGFASGQEIMPATGGMEEPLPMPVAGLPLRNCCCSC
jgi:hypothetical protein